MIVYELSFKMETFQPSKPSRAMPVPRTGSSFPLDDPPLPHPYAIYQ